MTSLSADQILARRTFANVAAAPSTPQQPSDPSSHLNPVAQNSLHVQNPIPQPARNEIITPAIPRKLMASPSNEAARSLPSIGLEPTPVLTSQMLSGTSDESNTQLSSSDDSAKPPSLDGKSVASVTTFAMDEKESLRPDDSASVKAIEDEDLYSPSAGGSRIGSESGARAFRDQLQEITSRGPATRPPGPTSRPDSSLNVPAGILYMPPPPIVGSSTLPDYIQVPPTNVEKAEDLLPDAKLLEALNNPRDRIWVLKLEQDIIDFVKESTEHSLDLPQCNSFYRMLAHKLADYYFLGHAVDESISAVRLYKTPACRIAPPLTAFTSPSTAANTPPPTAPQMKILRRGGDVPLAGLSKSSSDAGGDSAGDSDKNKAPLTREQREQRYEEARLRILGSAKPVEDGGAAAASKERDESRSSSAAGKKKPKKQRSNSDDDFEARSAYSTFTTPQNGVQDSGATVYYPTFPGNTPGMYNAPGSYAPQNSYSAVYGPMMPTQGNPYPWLQQGYSSYSDPNSQNLGQPQSSANDLAADFQAMSFHSHPQPTPPSQSGPYGYSSPQTQQQHPGWPQQTMPYQPGYPTTPGYPGQYASRPASSASHGSANQGYPYAMPPNQMHMPEQYMGYSNQAMANAYNRGPFNPQSQAFIPGYQSQYGSSGMPAHNGMGYGGPFPGPQALQRQNSTQSQASSYGGQRNTQESNRMTHPLPQPVFSPHVTMPYQNSQRTPSRSGNTTDKTVSPGNGNSAPSSIAKWGTPASLPAKPPPPVAGDSFDMSRLSQTQRNAAPSFNPSVAGRLPGVGGPGFHSLPPMVSIRGAQGPRPGQ